MSKLDEIISEDNIFDYWPSSAGWVKQQIKDLMLELIGEDEEPGRTMGPGMPSFQRDTLRRELRQKVNEL